MYTHAYPITATPSPCTLVDIYTFLQKPIRSCSLLEALKRWKKISPALVTFQRQEVATLAPLQINDEHQLSSKKMPRHPPVRPCLVHACTCNCHAAKVASRQNNLNLIYYYILYIYTYVCTFYFYATSSIDSSVRPHYPAPPPLPPTLDARPRPGRKGSH